MSQLMLARAAAALVLVSLAWLCPRTASAQAEDSERPPAFVHGAPLPNRAAVQSDESIMTPALHAAYVERRTATALLLTGLSSFVVGSIAGFFGFMHAFNDSDPLGPAQTIAGLVTTGVGLLSFFVGMGLDIDVRLRIGDLRRAAVALSPGGVAVTF